VYELEVHQIELEIQNKELTDSRRAVELSHERYVSLYDLAPVPFLTINRQGVIKEINLTACRLLGTERQALVNRSLISWVAAADKPKFRQLLSTPSVLGDTTGTTLRMLQRRTYEVPVQLQSTCTEDVESGEIWLRTAIFDLTEEHRLVQRLVSEKNMRERFVSALTHDLRTPLTAARMTAELLTKDARTEEGVRKRAGRIVEFIDRTDRMIRDLLDANRINAGQEMSLQLDSCDLVKLCESARVELLALYGERIPMNHPREILGYWDERGLRRAVENLVNNAVKYGSADTPVTVNLKEKNGWVEISVHNQGNPISEADQATLFRQFHRSEAANSGDQIGWGIGLTLVRGVAEAHGGRATVESSREKGTTFYIIIPKDARQRSDTLH
jgi:PAS domain S-box-containing protein